jgi:hypothetical protein
MYYNSAYITTLLNVTLLYLNLHLRLFLCKATPTSSRLHTVKVISSLRSGVLHHTGKRGQYMMPTLRNLKSRESGHRTPRFPRTLVAEAVPVLHRLRVQNLRVECLLPQ